MRKGRIAAGENGATSGPGRQCDAVLLQEPYRPKNRTVFAATAVRRDLVGIAVWIGRHLKLLIDRPRRAGDNMVMIELGQALRNVHRKQHKRHQPEHRAERGKRLLYGALHPGLCHRFGIEREGALGQASFHTGLDQRFGMS